MKHAALLTLGLALAAGAAVAATPVDRLAPLQGDWRNGGSTVTIKGSSARVTRLSAEDRKAGYGDGEILVQGLAWQRTDSLNNGERRLTFAGTCRTPTVGRKATTWVVSDCTLELTQSPDGAARLAAHTTALVMLSEVLFASVSSVLLGASSWDSRTLIGGALILLAALLSIVGPGHKTK